MTFLLILQLITITTLDIERVEAWGQQQVAEPKVSNEFEFMAILVYSTAFINWSALERYVGFQAIAGGKDIVPDAEQSILRLVGMGAIAYGINKGSLIYYKKNNQKFAWFLRIGSAAALSFLAVQNIRRGNQLRMEFEMEL